MGMVLYPLVFILAISFIGPWCPITAEVPGYSIEMICTIIITGLAIVMGIFNANKRTFSKDGPLGYLMNKRLGKPEKGWMEWDLYFIGPINEFISMSVMEMIMVAVVLAWLCIAVWARYTSLMNDTYGTEYFFGNKTRAFGKAMSQATLRLLLLSLISPNRNTIMIWFLGIPFERAMKYHKMAGRLMIVCMWIHFIAMLIGGTEEGVTRVTSSNGGYSTNEYGGPVLRQVKWDSIFTLYGSGTNLACGPIAFFFWNLLVITSLPYFRRKLFEVFYFLHFNLFFLANIMTIFHARTAAMVWIAPAFVLTYIDVSIRAIAKFSAVTPRKVEVIGDNITKLVLSVDSFPRLFFHYHAGSYVWLSCNLRKQINNDVVVAQVDEAGIAGKDDKVADTTNGIFTNIKVPGGPPSGLPSWLFFHPITISSYDPDTNEITLYIKSFGEGLKEWSAQLLQAAKLVQAGVLTMEDIGFHVGGPNGSLMIKEPLESLDCVLLFSGGIGCTPMVALLEDLLNKDYKGKVEFIWSTRSLAEIEAFTPLFNRCEGKSNFDVRVYYTGKDKDTSNAKGFTITAGRPSIASISLVKGESTGVLVCGPEQLMIDVESFVVDGQRNGMTVLFHRETFEF